MIFFEIIKKF